jgi:hypothetical protein
LIKFFVISAIVIGCSACTQTSEINTQEINQTQNNTTAPKTGLRIVRQRDLGFVKQFELSDGRVVRERDLAGLGLTAP